MKDDDIQKKLVELESAILKEAGPTEEAQLSRLDKGAELKTTNSPYSTGRKSGISQSTRSDIHYFGGIFLLLIGIILLFQHVRVTSGYMTYFGLSMGSSIGGLVILLLIGIGWVVYNSRSIWGWLISALSLCTMIFSIISGLRVHFIPINMLNLILMLLPLAFGAAFLLKGIGGAKGVEEIIKSRTEKGQ